MSKYAQVNVKFGADISSFSTAMQNAAREMKKAGDQLQNVGKSMTMNLTAPIVALGAAALYSFGQIDSLKRGLISFSGSAALAEEEFTKLREVAKLPGIGLQEAVSGSINLQAIGMSADKARIAMTAFGNAIATVGGGKESFDLAIRGFGQLMNASKPLQQDLYQIANQLPQINKLMIEAFGTNRAEDLAKMGISGKQLADFLVTELGKLPKVTGGIKNSFENMSDSIKISLASLGESIEKNFNISGKINAISDLVGKLVSRFQNLNPETQKFILSMVGLVAAVGPVLLGIGVLVNLLPTLMAGFGVLTTAVTLASAAMKGFTTAMLAGPGVFVAIVGAIALAVIAMANWRDTTSEATKRLEEQREATKKLREEQEKLNNPLLNKKKADVMEGVDLYGTGKGYADFRNKGMEGGGGEFIYLGDVGEKAKTKIPGNAGQLTLEQIKEAAEKARREAEIQAKLNGEQTINNWEQQEYWNNLGIENFTNSFSGIVDAGPVIEEGNSMIQDNLQRMRDQTRQALAEFSAETEQQLNAMANTMQRGVEGMIISLAAAFGENLVDGDPFKNLGNILLDSLGKLMQALGAEMILMSTLGELWKKLMSNPLTWGAAIPVGIAMVAAGAAISKIAQKGMQPSGASGGYSSSGGTSSGGGNLALESRLDGRDIVLSGSETTRVSRR